MNPKIKNILAVIAGIILGSAVNFVLLNVGKAIIPFPEGIDIKNPDSLKNGMHLMETRHFITPFLAHALGTFAGAATCGVLAAGNKRVFAFCIGIYFLIMGILNMKMIGSPLNFNIVDGLFAYLPMGWLAGLMFGSENKEING